MAVTDQIKSYMPSFGGIKALDIFNIVTYLILFVIFSFLVGIGVYLFVQRLKYNKQVVIFEKINGQFEPIKKDRAMLISHGRGGDKIFYIRKLKRYQPMPAYQTGRNTYWFWLRQDGELINFTPGDFDWESKQLGAKFLDKEMRYARVELQETLKERYNKPKFWEKYGGFILNIVAIAIILLFFWLIVREFLNSLGALQTVTDTTNKVLDRASTVISSLDNICTGGSGIKPAT